MCEKTPDTFGLKAACKDCPFRKENGYLTAQRVEQIIDYMRNGDLLFPCHKTVNHELRIDHRDAVEEIEDIISDANSEEERQKLKVKLEAEYNIKELEEALSQSIRNEEKICAGWLILGKKAGIVFNNFPLRFAAMRGELNLDLLKNEEDVFDSIEDAIKAHS